jgi:hypothetical protein
MYATNAMRLTSRMRGMKTHSFIREECEAEAEIAS